VQKKPRTPRFDEYLAGAFFGYTVSILPLLIASYFLQVYNLDPNAVNPYMLFFLVSAPTFLGGVVAGYAVARRSEIDHWKVGIKAGLGCLFLNGLITGLITGQPQSPLALASLFLGCVFSGYLYGKICQKKIQKQNK